jgi:predicted protein tyrosine phosphatase
MRPQPHHSQTQFCEHEAQERFLRFERVPATPELLRHHDSHRGRMARLHVGITDRPRALARLLQHNHKSPVVAVERKLPRLEPLAVHRLGVIGRQSFAPRLRGEVVAQFAQELEVVGALFA